MIERVSRSQIRVAILTSANAGARFIAPGFPHQDDPGALNRVPAAAIGRLTMTATKSRRTPC
jgi:uroporphyrinogen-III synthase